jgi:FtsZ-interacting cell division protein ZipA
MFRFSSEWSATAQRCGTSGHRVPAVIHSKERSFPMNIRTSLLALALSAVAVTAFGTSSAFADPSDANQDVHQAAQEVRQDTHVTAQDVRQGTHEAAQEVRQDTHAAAQDVRQDMHHDDDHDMHYNRGHHRMRSVCTRYRHHRCVSWSRRYHH